MDLTPANFDIVTALTEGSKPNKLILPNFSNAISGVGDIINNLRDFLGSLKRRVGRCFSTFLEETMDGDVFWLQITLDWRCS